MEAPFIGREAELAQLEPLLEAHRLVTLTGAGGYGKTRLAGELARRAHSTARVEEAHLVPMGEPATAEAASLAILAALGSRPEPGRDSVDTLAARFEDRAALLVLDGCERLADARVAEIGALLERCPKLRILATSRRPLALEGEVAWQVPPMSGPQLAGEPAMHEVLESDAARLFVAIASRRAPAFGLTAETAGPIARICAGLDGVPLAIELAAARVPEQSLEAIVESLAGQAGDGLHASLDWSYELLGKEAQQLFRRLGVLSGASAADTVAVCGSHLSSQQAREALDGLADLGLVVVQAGPPPGDIRYAMLGSVRGRALELLGEAGETEEARELHLEHFAALASESGRLLNDGGRRVLDQQSANLRAALEYAIERRDPVGLAMCEGLTYWWFAADRFDEGRDLCARALAAAADGEPADRALVKRGAALLAVATERYVEAHQLANEALALAEQGSDERALGLSVQATNFVLGTVDPSGAAERGWQATELLRGAGSEHDLGHALLTLAATEALRDRFESFDALRAEFMALPAARNDEWLTILMDLHAAWARLMQGDPRAAGEEADRALRRLGGEVSMRGALAQGHRVHAMAWGGDPERALERGLAEIEVAREAGSEVGVLTIELASAAAELVLGDYDSVASRAEPNLAAPALHAIVFWREALARIALEREEPSVAGEHAAAIRVVGERSESPRQAAVADYLDGVVALQGDDLERAASLLHRALAAQDGHRCHRDAADTLEALGLLAGKSGDPRRAIHLQAASGAARRQIGCVRVCAESEAAVAAREEVERSLEPEQARRARTEGDRLAPAEAIAYAQRSRGRRERATVGWASLTPTESKAAELAAQGLSNPEIAERLLMSRSTVKTHLSRAYAKLGVANRVELAAQKPPDLNSVGEP